MTTTVPAPWCRSIAEELHRIAYDLGNVANIEGGLLPEPGYVQLHIQPAGDEARQIAAIDDLGRAVAGKTGCPEEMHDGSYHYIADAQRGPVTFKAYTSIDTPTALRLIAEDEQAQKDAEIERLRARVAELEAREDRPAEPEPERDADPLGLGVDLDRSQAADSDETPVPVAGRRYEPHTGGMTEQGLVDETPVEPVTVYFSFGHGQTDPDTGKDLLDHYVTVVGPSYDACRQAMFDSRYGQAWSFDYLAGSPSADEWIPRWTEHERIELTATGRLVDESALNAARGVLGFGPCWHGEIAPGRDCPGSGPDCGPA